MRWSYIQQVWVEGWGQMRPPWSLVPLVSLLAFLLGGVASIALWLFGVEPSWTATISGALSALGLLGVICNFLVGAPYQLWKSDEPLRQLREKQRKGPRDYIHPILTSVDWGLAKPSGGAWSGVRIRLALASLLVFQQEISRLRGTLSFSVDNTDWAKVEIPDFTGAPPRLFPAAISGEFSQDVVLSEDVKEKVRRLWNEKRQRPAMHLAITMERPDGDAIQFDPPADHPLRLAIPFDKPGE